MENELIKVAIKYYYDLDVDKIEKIGHSSTDCYVIICNNKKYFVKVFDKHKETSKIQQEYYLLKILKENGFLVPEIIRAKNKEIYIGFSEYYMFIEKYLSGYSCAELDISDDILLKSSTLLGKMHRLLNNKYDDENKEYYWNNPNIEDERIFLNSVVEAINREKADERIRLLRASVENKQNKIYRLKEMSNMFHGITYLMSHGDYSKRNLLCDSSNNIMIVDFSDSGVFSASCELIRSYFYSTESCKNGKIFDYDLFYKYIEAYSNEFRLDDKDIELMPYLFLYQILISRYGYKEYLQSKDKKLIDYIKWKDNILFFLENNADAIVKKIKMCYNQTVNKNK